MALKPRIGVSRSSKRVSVSCEKDHGVFAFSTRCDVYGLQANLVGLRIRCELSGLLASFRTGSWGARGPNITSMRKGLHLGTVCSHDLGSNWPSFILMSVVST